MPDQTLAFPVRPLQPGGYSALDTAALASSGRVEGAPVVAVIGDCKGGKPNSILRFRTPQALRSILRSGPAYDTARATMLAARGRGGDVIVVRVGNGIAQSVKALAGATSAPVTLTSIGYGAWTNGIKVTVAANNKVTITFTDLLGNTFTETYAVGAAATPQNIVDAINGVTQGFAKSAYFTAAVTAGTTPLTVAAIANAAGGADSGTIISGDWTNGLTPLEAVDVDLVVPATGDATVHAQVKAHCDITSTTLARKERTAVHGGVLGETGTQAAARAAAINANRSQLVWPGAYIYDDNGVVTLYDPFVVAGGIAGEHASLPDQATSLVHTTLDWVVDTERALSTVPGGELDVALAAGVTPLNVAEGGNGIWVVDSLSTNVSVKQLADFHKIRTADTVAKIMRRRLGAKFVGGKTLNGTTQSVALDAAAGLDVLVRSELIRDKGEVEVTEDVTPGAFLVVMPVILPDTNKFILLTVALRPPSATSATAA